MREIGDGLANFFGHIHGREIVEKERARERILVSYLKMTEREVMGESVRSSEAREIEKNGEMRRGRLMEERRTGARLKMNLSAAGEPMEGVTAI